MTDLETGLDQRRPQGVAASRIARPLLGHVLLVTQRGNHGGLHRRRRDHAGVLAHREQLADQRRVAAHETGTITGQVGPLGERVDGQHAGVVATGHLVGEHRHRLGLPAQRQIALVADHDRVALAGPRDHLAQVLGGQDLPGRVGRRVDPDELHPLGTDRGERVGPDHPGAGQAHTDLVRRVADLGDDHLVPRAGAEQRGQPRDKLLGADRGQHPELTRGAARPGQPARDRGPQLRGAGGQRVAGRVGGPDEGLPDDRGDRIDRRADREVDDAVRMGGGEGLGRLQQVPGEIRQGRRQSAQCASPRGACATTKVASLSILPTLEAPPGEPRSSKNS